MEGRPERGAKNAGENAGRNMEGLWNVVHEKGLEANPKTRGSIGASRRNNRAPLPEAHGKAFRETQEGSAEAARKAPGRLQEEPRKDVRKPSGRTQEGAWKELQSLLEAISYGFFEFFVFQLFFFQMVFFCFLLF